MALNWGFPLCVPAHELFWELTPARQPWKQDRPHPLLPSCSQAVADTLNHSRRNVIPALYQALWGWSHSPHGWPCQIHSFSCSLLNSHCSEQVGSLGSNLREEAQAALTAGSASQASPLHPHHGSQLLLALRACTKLNK